ncbi:MAG: ABC transporter permease [Saprospiraceae bacterium]|nr:ABC transporter permease [Saprospiraceae bacterium]
MKSILYTIGTSIIVLVSAVVLISSIIYLAPVDPARLTFGQRTDSASLERKQAELFLDKPLHIQMLYYLNDISPVGYGNGKRYAEKQVPHVKITGGVDGKGLLLKSPYFRESFQSGKRVALLLKDAIPKTLILALAAMGIAILFGICLGIFAALVKDTWLDQFIIGVSVIGISVPSYVSAIVLALIFGFVLRDYTGLNIQGSIFDINDIGDEVVVWKNLILPAIALGVRPLAIITQLMRSSLLDVLTQDYMRTAKAKGLKFKDIVLKHAIKNSLNPVFTAVTGWFASLLAGAFFVENVFNFKGIGGLTVNALINYDIPILLGCVIFVCTAFILINILVDYGYKLFDPKVN